MKKVTMEKEEKKDSAGSTIAKIAVGAAAVGAGIIAVKALSKEENREKIKSGLNKAKDRGKEFVESAKDKLTQAKDEATLTIEKLEKELQATGEKVNEFLTDNQNADQRQKLKDRMDSIKNEIKLAATEEGEDMQKRVDDIKVDLKELSSELKK